MFLDVLGSFEGACFLRLSRTEHIEHMAAGLSGWRRYLRQPDIPAAPLLSFKVRPSQTDRRGYLVGAVTCAHLISPSVVLMLIRSTASRPANAGLRDYTISKGSVRSKAPDSCA